MTGLAGDAYEDLVQIAYILPMQERASVYGDLMLNKMYVNNFRCLVNFELEFNELTLLLGPNGGGKSTVFDLIFRMRRLLVDNVKISDIFPVEDITAWTKLQEQSVELHVQGNDGSYCYKLSVSHNPDIKKQYIDFEYLSYNEKPLFEFNKGTVQLYHDDHTFGPSYPFDFSVSALALIAPRTDNTKLTWFKQWIEKALVLGLQPKAMVSETFSDSSWLNRDGTNFASWYLYLSAEHQDRIFVLRDKLQQVLPGFHSFKLEAAGKHKILKVGFLDGGENAAPIFFDFEQLSDGQRIVIVLHALVFGLQGLGYTLFLDEPENYVSLREIQPWLVELKLASGEGFPRAVLISHHPELIDYLGPDCGKWIERDSLGPVRVHEMPQQIDAGLKLSEQIARGWE